MKQALKPRQEGYVVLITVLILGVVATTIAIFLIITGTDTSLTSAGVEAAMESRGGALACAELALASIQSNPTLVTPSTNTSTLDATTSEQCSYQISGSSPNYAITTIGSVHSINNTYTRHMTIDVDQVSPKLHVSAWQDTP